MGYRHDLWEVAASQHGVLVLAEAEDAGVPAAEVWKLASRGAIEALGKGVYRHRDVPRTRFTQSAAAVALAGKGAFLHLESVLDLLELGQLNPRQIRVATRRRVRRTLPEWMELTYRPGVVDDDLTEIEGIAATTVTRALNDTRDRMPPDRWERVAAAAVQRGFVGEHEVTPVGTETP